MTVHILPLKGGGVDAHHTFASSGDADTAAARPDRGVYQIAHGLLLEALRRESYLSALTELTKDPEYLSKYLGSSLKNREDIELKLAETVTEVIHQGSKKLTPGITKGVFEMLISQTGGGLSPSEE